MPIHQLTNSRIYRSLRRNQCISHRDAPVEFPVRRRVPLEQQVSESGVIVAGSGRDDARVERGRARAAWNIHGVVGKAWLTAMRGNRAEFQCADDAGSRQKCEYVPIVRVERDVKIAPARPWRTADRERPAENMVLSSIERRAGGADGRQLIERR